MHTGCHRFSERLVGWARKNLAKIAFKYIFALIVLCYFSPRFIKTHTNKMSTNLVKHSVTYSSALLLSDVFLRDSSSYCESLPNKYPTKCIRSDNNEIRACYVLEQFFLELSRLLEEFKGVQNRCLLRNVYRYQSAICREQGS